MKPRRAQRRREMTDGHGTQPAFCLYRLAWIVDDERINDRQRARHGFGPTRGGKCQRLAGQPLQRAVGTEMNQRVDLRLLPQPRIERNIGMPWGNRNVVIAGLAITRRSAVGLEKNQELSDFEHRKRKSVFYDDRVGVGVAPRFFNLALQTPRQSLQPSCVSSKGNVEARGLYPEQHPQLKCPQFFPRTLV